MTKQITYCPSCGVQQRVASHIFKVDCYNCRTKFNIPLPHGITGIDERKQMIVMTPFGGFEFTDMPQDLRRRLIESEFIKKGLPDRRADPTLWDDVSAWGESEYHRARNQVRIELWIPADMVEYVRAAANRVIASLPKETTTP